MAAPVLIAGELYTARATIRNRSTRAGAPVEAAFEVVMTGEATVPFPTKRADITIPADGQGIVDFPLSVPSDAGGSGFVKVAIVSPTGITVASARLDVLVESPTGDVSGHVYDMATGEPLGGVSIDIDGHTGQTNAEGDYHIPGVPVGVYSATFALSGYAPTVYVDNFEVVEGVSTYNVGLVPLPAAASLEGLVTDDRTGYGIMEVLVTLTAYRTTETGGTEQIYHEARTDVNGFYRFSEVEARDFAISFIKETEPLYETKQLPIYLTEGPNVFNVNLTPIITGLRLYFTNPQAYAVIWDAQVAEVKNGIAQEWITGKATGALKELHVPIDFQIDYTTFLLRVMELPRAPLPGPYWFGPYLIDLPSLGERTWNSREGSMDDVKAVNMPLTSNQSKVTGIITGFAWRAEAQWGVSLSIESAEQVSGENWAAFFKSLYIPYATMPLDSLGAPVLGVGDKVTCMVQMIQDTYDAAWKAWDFKRPSEYPPEAYNFSGTVTVGGVVRKQYVPDPGLPWNWVWDNFRQIFWSVSGGIPPFAVQVIALGLFGNVTGGWRDTGPTSGIYEVLESMYQYGYEGTLRIYAHPNPNASEWGQYTWEVDGWKGVG